MMLIAVSVSPTGGRRGRSSDVGPSGDPHQTSPAPRLDTDHTTSQRFADQPPSVLAGGAGTGATSPDRSATRSEAVVTAAVSARSTVSPSTIRAGARSRSASVQPPSG